MEQHALFGSWPLQEEITEVLLIWNAEAVGTAPNQTHQITSSNQQNWFQLTLQLIQQDYDKIEQQRYWKRRLSCPNGLNSRLIGPTSPYFRVQRSVEPICVVVVADLGGRFR